MKMLMLTKVIAVRPILFGVVISFVFLATARIAVAHGDEDHEDAPQDTAQIEMAEDDSAAIVMDSVLTTIGLGFKGLQPIFERACFDCHTTRTRYPWYYKLPLVKGLIDKDTRDAKKHVDMSEGYPFKGHGRPADDLMSIRDAIVDGEMPPWQYRLIHWDAKPSDKETVSIVNWIDESLRLLAAHGVYPYGRADLVPGSGTDASREDSDHGDHDH